MLEKLQGISLSIQYKIHELIMNNKVKNSLGTGKHC